MQMQVAEVAIEVQKKKIKNMHLYVKPPCGRVVISAPLRVPNKAIEQIKPLNSLPVPIFRGFGGR